MEHVWKKTAHLWLHYAFLLFGYDYGLHQHGLHWELRRRKPTTLHLASGNWYFIPSCLRYHLDDQVWKRVLGRRLELHWFPLHLVEFHEYWFPKHLGSTQFLVKNRDDRLCTHAPRKDLLLPTYLQEPLIFGNHALDGYLWSPYFRFILCDFAHTVLAHYRCAWNR